MSIYGSSWSIWLEEEEGGRQIEINVQIVPSFITDDLSYLPPPRTTDPDEGERMGYEHPRAAFFCAPWTIKALPGKGGQEYTNALLVLTGEEYEQIPYREVIQKLQDAIREHRALGYDLLMEPWWEWQTRRAGGELRWFGTFKEALEDAKDPAVWKISGGPRAGVTDTRMRLVRIETGDFVLEPITGGLLGKEEAP